MNVIFYRIFLFMYACGIELASLFNKKARLWLKGRIKIFKRLRKALKGNKAPIIWFHCASLGEFEQGRPLLEKIKTDFPSHKILLTFFSPSGYEIHKNYALADFVFYLPLDGEWNARKFIEIVKPSLVVFVKYEFWYFYLKKIKEKNIPLILVSGIFRKDQPFFKWYGGLHRKMLAYFTHLFIQDKHSERLLQLINISHCTICGDTRTDRVLDIVQHWQPIEKIAAFCASSPTIVAGSTWYEDDEVLNHYVNSHPDFRFIIAPHEIDQDRLKECQTLYKNALLYSQYITANMMPPGTNTLIIDNMGMLSQLYKYGSICFVGGAFGDDGVHNVLEAAVYNKPVVFGPVFHKFLEAKDLVKQGAAFAVENVLELEQTFDALLQDPNLYKAASEAAENYIQSHTGATTKILDYIKHHFLN